MTAKIIWTEPHGTGRINVYEINNSLGNYIEKTKYTVEGTSFSEKYGNGKKEFNDEDDAIEFAEQLREKIGDGYGRKE